MPDLKALLNTPGIRLGELTDHLEALPHSQRVAQALALGRTEQSRLWNVAEGSEPLDLGYVLPEGAEPLEPFPFEGKNTLPAFTRFRKVFYRTTEGTVGGYNDSPVGWLVGPGYYVCRLADDRPGELAVDYLQVPQSHPAGWPEIRPNEAGVSRFVYGGTVDYLRWVSPDVVIGRAFKGGTKPMPAWFVLARAKPREG